MNLNVTLVFQVFNFLIAYLILERFFFRNAFCVVQKRDCQIKSLKESVAIRKRNIEEVRVHVDEQWQQYQRALRSEIPAEKTRHVGPPPVIQEVAYEHDEQKERRLIEKLEEDILSYFVTANAKKQS